MLSQRRAIFFIILQFFVYFFYGTVRANSSMAVIIKNNK